MVLVLAVVLGLGGDAGDPTPDDAGRPRRAEETQEVLVAARLQGGGVLKPDMVQAVPQGQERHSPAVRSPRSRTWKERWVKTTMLEGDLILDKKLGPKGTPPGLAAHSQGHGGDRR